MPGKEVRRTRFGDDIKWLFVRRWSASESVRLFEHPTCSEDTCPDEGGGRRRLTLAGSNLHESRRVEVFSGC